MAAADGGDQPDGETIRHAWDVRSRDLVEARVGLAQAVAALTEELDERRRQLAAAQAERDALLEHAESERASALELAAQLERAQAELARLRRSPPVRCARAAKRLISRVRARLR